MLKLIAYESVVVPVVIVAQKIPYRFGSESDTEILMGQFATLVAALIRALVALAIAAVKQDRLAPPPERVPVANPYLMPIAV